MPLAPGLTLCGIDAVGASSTDATVVPWNNTSHNGVNAATPNAFLIGQPNAIGPSLNPADPLLRPRLGYCNLGTNCLGSDADVTTGITNYHTLASQMGAAIVSPLDFAILTVPIRNDGSDVRRASWNSQLPGVVDSFNSAGIPCWLFDLSSVITSGDVGNGVDTVHYNNGGMAAAGLYVYRVLRWLAGMDGSPQPRLVGRVPTIPIGDSQITGLYGGSPTPQLYPGGLRNVCSSYYWLNTPPLSLPVLIPLYP